MVSKIAKALPRIGTFLPTMQPTYAAFDEVMTEHGGRTFAEVKYDGYRVQVHRGNVRTKIFTRNGNELNYACYPDITGIVDSLPVCIIEAELVGEGTSHKEVYDNVKSRFRLPGIKQETVDKYLQSGIVSGLPLSLRVFDTLRFEKQGILYLPLTERRKHTESFDCRGVVPSEARSVADAKSLERLVNKVFREGHEGIVCKNPASAYRPGSQSVDWVKFKRHETLDLVVVGVYFGKGARDLPFASVLCATYNDESGVYETIGKIGVTRDDLAKHIDGKIRGNLSNQSPGSVVFSDKLERRIYCDHVPDLYVSPEKSVVLEVNALNICRSDNWQSCGAMDGKAFSLRIGYAVQMRPDKSPKQATTTRAIARLYALQEGGA
jgi:DNA ligase-1